MMSETTAKIMTEIADLRADSLIATTMYRCGCGEWMGEGCEWVGPASGMTVVEYTPEHLRDTAVASGRLDTGTELVAVSKDCWRYIQKQEAFDASWWAETDDDPAACAEAAEGDADE